jgi:hypothetical protein
MAITTLQRSRIAGAVDARRARQAVTAFAAIGLAFLCWEAWTLVAWIADGPAAVTQYRDSGDASMVWARALELFAVGFAVYMFFLLARGVRRERRFTIDAMFAVAGLTSFWLDPFYNFFRPNLLYSSQWINVGTWCGHVPFVANTDCRYVPEPVVFVGLWYVVGVPAAAMVGSALMSWVQRRFPSVSWTPVKLVAVALGFGVALDMVWEIPLVMANVWKYVSYPSWSALPGLPAADRYPAAPALAGAILFGGMAVVRYFRNDRGQTFIESGVAHIDHGRRRTAMMLLSSIGIVQVFALACITPIMLLWPYNERWPEYPAHILNGMCEQPRPGTYVDRFC